MDALKSHRDRSLLHTRTEASASSSDSYSIPSPQLVERSGVSTPEAFFYVADEENSPRIERNEKVKNWTRGLEPTSLKRYLEPLQQRKLTTAEIKQRETAVRTANLIRQKQRAFTPLLTLEKPSLIGTRQYRTEQETGRFEAKPHQLLVRPAGIRLIRPTEAVRNSAKRTEGGTGQGLSRAGQMKPVQKAQIKQTSFKGTSLKPLRSLTPQISRQAPSKALPK